MSSNLLVLLPCAGLGTRMNMPKNKSKELLIDPNTNQPIIEWSINLCKKNKLDFLIITRKEKKDLIKYCEEHNYKTLILEDETKEWPATLLEASPYWRRYNILLLPDTRFKPEKVLEEIKQSLTLGNRLAFALHKVKDISKWGMVHKGTEAVTYCEKAKEDFEGEAWGLIGFTKNIGLEIFNNMLIRGARHYLSNDRITTHKLKSFVDITRTGKVEKY